MQLNSFVVVMEELNQNFPDLEVFLRNKNLSIPLVQFLCILTVETIVGGFTQDN